MHEHSDRAPRNDVLSSLVYIRRAKVRARIYEGALLSLTVLLLAVLLSTFLELLLNFGSTGRGIVFFSVLAAFTYVTLRYFAPQLITYFGSPRNDELLDAALKVGAAYPELRDRLRNAVELMSPSGDHSGELAQAYVEKIFGQAAVLDFKSQANYRTSKSLRIIFAMSIAATAITFIILPSQAPSAFARIVNFTHHYATPDAYSITVLPGNAELSRGDTLTVETALSPIMASRLPSQIVLHEKYAGESEFEKHLVKEAGHGKYIYRLPNVRESMEYFVSAGNQSSPRYRVNVVDLPIVRNFTFRLSYPGYTGKPPATLQENIGDFTALVGTRAELSLSTNKNLTSAWIAFGDSTLTRLSVDGDRASGAFVVRRTAKYTLQLLDRDSLRNRDPIVYSVQAVNDEYPTCEITYPGKDEDLSRDMQLPLRISIGDDYGFTRLLLQFRLTKSKFAPADKDYHSVEIPIPSKSAGQEDISYTWDLTSLDLVPEDVISYHARVFDNDAVSGPKSTVSAEYSLRLPSLQEVFASADSEHSDLVRKTEDALSSSDELKNQLDRISQEMKTATKQMSWEQQKKMENSLQSYDSLQKKIEGVKKQIESMTQKMLENRVISPQTLEKYLELQKALQDVNSPEFQEALKKLQQAIQSLNPNLVRQAMQNFQLNEEMLRKSIERTLSLIKRVQIEQKLDELGKRADQMIARQDALRKSTAETDSMASDARDSLSDAQKDIKDELAQTEQAMSDLKNKMDEFPDEMPLKELAGAKASLDSSGVRSKMREAQSELSQGNFSKSISAQNQISSALKKFRRQLEQAQKSLLNNQQKATVDALRKAQQNLLEISREQESLRNESGSTPPNSAESRDLADRQNELIQQLGYTSQQMMRLSNKSFAVTPNMGRQIGEAYAQMQRALNNLQSRSGESPTQSQSQAMGAMNKAVLSIQSTLQAMMQGQAGGGGSSLMQQLQQMAGEQEGLNSLTSQLGEEGAMSIEQQAELARLAAQQEAIQKSLEQLAGEADQSQSPNRVLGNLDRIAKEMGDVVKDLGSRNITQETIRRQEKILSHLLDASRSIRQRDYDNRRVTRAGTDVKSQSPAELNLTNSNSEEEEQLLNLIRENFPPEYQQVILKYYRLLKKSPD
jgi:Domain of unknown function (DUF4175)